MTSRQKWGFAIAFGGAAIAGAAVLLAGRKGSQLGAVRARVKSPAGTLTHHRGRMPIQRRVALLQDLVWKSVQDPEMRKLALQITKGCQARDGKCEARAIHDWTKRNIRYTGDVAPVKMGSKGPYEGVDLFQSGPRTADFGGGDCDDHSVLNATLLSLNGIPARFRITATQRARGDNWSHIYVLAGLPKTNPTEWVAVDTTLPSNYGSFGTEAPFAKRADFPA